MAKTIETWLSTGGLTAMKLWKRTVALMPMRFCCSRLEVNYSRACMSQEKRSLNNIWNLWTTTYKWKKSHGTILGQSKYEQNIRNRKKSIWNSSFWDAVRKCSSLIPSKKEAVVNRTDYEIVSMDNLGLITESGFLWVQIQKLNHKYLLLQHALPQIRGLRNTFQSVMLLLCLWNWDRRQEAWL